MGDENNRDRHGALAGYAVLALDLHYQATRRLALFARVDNALDRRYAISGQLGRHSKVERAEHWSVGQPVFLPRPQQKYFDPDQEREGSRNSLVNLINSLRR